MNAVDLVDETPFTLRGNTEMPSDVIRTIEVLLIEDSHSDAQLIRAHLVGRKDLRFLVSHATNLEEGVRALRAKTFDIAVVDLTLPDSSGIDTFQSLRATGASVPIVILSGTSDEDVALEAVRRGALGFFAKNEVIHEFLGRMLLHAIEQFHRQRAEREIEAAGFIQRRLYPKPLPAMRNFDIAGRCDPANQVGGDYFDYFMTDERNLTLVVGDVAGHGFGPALVMAETRAALRTMAAMTDRVESLMYQANQLLCNDETYTFVTLFLIRIDIETGSCAYASAGHPSELIHIDGTFKTLDSDNLPLGIQPQMDVDVRRAVLQPGDTILMYTDGINERANSAGEQFGPDRVRDVAIEHSCDSATNTLEAIFDAAKAFGNGLPAFDDMSAIILKAI